MKNIILTGIMGLFPLFVFSQNTEQDSLVDISQYYINTIEETSYDLSKLDSIKDTRIAIIPPEHFIFAEDIPGYIHPGTSASIQIKDIDGTSWPVIDKVMTKEHFESQGVTLLNRKEIELYSGLSGVIYTVSFEAKGVKFERKMLFAGDYNYTIWLNANYPVSLKKTLVKPLMSSLLTANIIEK
ncbi:MAG: hypothetical protein R6V32_10580 [Bacteroidales bacterium]